MRMVDPSLTALTSPAAFSSLVRAVLAVPLGGLLGPCFHSDFGLNSLFFPVGARLELGNYKPLKVAQSTLQFQFL